MKRLPQIVSCMWCGAETCDMGGRMVPKRYCSATHAKAMHKRRARERARPLRPIQECAICGIEFVPLMRRGPPAQHCKACQPLRKHRNNARRRAARRRGESIDLLYIYRRDGGICGLCQRRVGWAADRSKNGPTLDHIIPLARGGTHTADNLQLAHRACNVGKRDNSWGSQLLLIG